MAETLMLLDGCLLVALSLGPSAGPAPESLNRAVHPEALAHWELAQFHVGRQSQVWTPGPAFVNYAKAIELDPDFAAPYLDRGKLYFGRDELDKALADLNTAVRLVPHFAGALILRGDLHLARNDCRQALADFDTAARLLTTSRKPVHALGHEYAVSWHQGLDYAYARRCLARLGLKDRTGAMADLELAVRNLPTRLPRLSEQETKEANRWRAAQYHLAAAWVLATHPDGAARDGNLALELATTARERFGGAGEPAVDAYPVLAAIEAELGLFSQAAAWEKKYAKCVEWSQTVLPLWASRARLGEYEKGRPWRQHSTWHLPENR